LSFTKTEKWLTKTWMGGQGRQLAHLNLHLSNVFILNNKHSIVAESRRYDVGYSIKTSRTHPCLLSHTLMAAKQ
jgi:hypothetical protein